MEVLLDDGYLGRRRDHPGQAITPPRKPNKNALPPVHARWERDRHGYSSDRVTVEHALADHKRWKQPTRWTHRRDRLPATYQAITGLVSDRAAAISILADRPARPIRYHTPTRCKRMWVDLPQHGSYGSLTDDPGLKCWSSSPPSAHRQARSRAARATEGIRRMLDSSNVAAPDAPGFYSYAAMNPDRPAITDTDGSVTTCGTLLRRVNALSHTFLAHSFKAGDAMARVLYNGKAFFEAVLADGQLGLHYVPVNWHLSPSELTYIIQDSRAQLVIADTEQTATFRLDELPQYRYSVRGKLPGWDAFEKLSATEPIGAPAARYAGTFMGSTSWNDRPSQRRQAGTGPDLLRC